MIEYLGRRLQKLWPPLIDLIRVGVKLFDLPWDLFSDDFAKGFMPAARKNLDASDRTILATIKK